MLRHQKGAALAVWQHQRLLAGFGLAVCVVRDRARKVEITRFAAGVAKQLIRIGVRCVIAAGWAVEDEPAYQFIITNKKKVDDFRDRFGF